MKVDKFDYNEGWNESKGFLRAKNIPKVPVSCSCLSNGSRTPESHLCFFCIEITLKYIKLYFFSPAMLQDLWVKNKRKLAWQTPGLCQNRLWPWRYRKRFKKKRTKRCFLNVNLQMTSASSFCHCYTSVLTVPPSTTMAFVQLLGDSTGVPEVTRVWAGPCGSSSALFKERLEIKRMKPLAWGLLTPNSKCLKFK